MPDNDWRGDSQAVAQVDRFTVGGTPAAGQIYAIPANRKDVSYTALGNDTNALIAAGLYARLTASSGVPTEISEASFSYTANTTEILATATTPGRPFDFGNTANGTGTLVRTTLTTSRGPSHVDDANNWTLSVLPVDGDDVTVRGGAPLLYGLASLATVHPASFTIEASFTGTIGLPYRNSAGYVEYRDRYLQLGNCPSVVVGSGCGTGSSSLFLQVGNGSTTVDVVATANRSDTTIPALNITGTGTTNVLNVNGGDVGLAVEPGTAAGYATIRLPEGQSQTSGQRLTIGNGATVGDVTQFAGTIDAYASIDTLTQADGTYTQWAGVLGSVTSEGGRVVLRSGGTTADAFFRGQPERTTPVLDCTQDPTPRTLTNSSFLGGAQLLDPLQSAAFSTPAVFDEASLKASDLGARINLQRS